MMAGLLVVSMCALASWACDTTHWEAGPQYTLAKAMVPGWAPGCGLRPRYTEYSVMAPAELAGGSQERWAPSALYIQGEESRHGDVPLPSTTPSSPPTLLILMAEGAPGNPGMQVLKAVTSLKLPVPQVLMAATRNL